MARRVSRLRLQTAIILVLLGGQFLLGVVVNLYVRIPPHHPGSSGDNYFVRVVQSVLWALIHGPLALVLHVIVGLALFISAAILLVFTIRARHRASIIAATIGFLSIIAAGFNGGSFLNFNSDAISSLIMSIAFAVATAAYVIALSLTNTGRVAPFATRMEGRRG